jgi:hypothetical protein
MTKVTMIQSKALVVVITISAGFGLVNFDTMDSVFTMGGKRAE